MAGVTDLACHVFLLSNILLKHSQVHSFIHCLWLFGATVAELTNCCRDYMVHKA